MTANQIAWYSAQEAKRHDEKQEDIADKANEIEERKAEWTREYQANMLSLDKWYKETYMNYLNASQDWKQHYESELASIEHQKQLVDQEYKAVMSAVAQDQVAIDAAKQSDTAWYNNQKLDIERKSLEFEKTRWNEERELRQNQYQLQFLEFNWAKTQFYMNQTLDYKKLQLDTLGLDIKRNQFTLDALEFDKRKRLIDAQVWSTYTNPFFSVLSGTGNTAGRMLGGNLKLF